MTRTELNPDNLGDDNRPMKSCDDVSQSNFPANMQTHLAWLRTRMSLETTLDSWIRTGTSLIGFGFTIVQFFEHLNGTQSVFLLKGPHLTRYVGLLLIGNGTIALGIAVWQYVSVFKYLEGEAFQGIAGVPGMRPTYPALVVAIVLCLVGLLAFFTILVGGELPWPGKL